MIEGKEYTKDRIELSRPWNLSKHQNKHKKGRTEEKIAEYEEKTRNNVEEDSSFVARNWNLKCFLQPNKIKMYLKILS